MINYDGWWMSDLYPDLENVEAVTREELREFTRCHEGLVLEMSDKDDEVAK